MNKEELNAHIETLRAVKAKYLPGPWHDEPDRVDFKHAGFDCLAQRNQMGAWCGYVGVPPGHPLHGKGYSDLDEIRVHGGLTFSGECHGTICHVSEGPDKVWWFGFDCNHCFDLAPGMETIGIGRGDVYRSLPYVKQEIVSLAEQLAELATEAA